MRTSDAGGGREDADGIVTPYQGDALRKYFAEVAQDMTLEAINWAGAGAVVAILSPLLALASWRAALVALGLAASCGCVAWGTARLAREYRAMSRGEEP